MKTTKTIKFNKSSLDAIPTPEKRTKYYSDEVKGLVLEITPKGAKSFRVLYSHNYTSKAYTIGSYPDITPSVAITRAKELRALITQGLDPQAEKKEKQKEHTFKSFFIDRYIPMQIARRNMKTTAMTLPNGRIKFNDIVEGKNGKLLEGYNAHIKNAKFVNKKLSEITERDIHFFINSIGSNSMANRLIRELRAIFNKTDLSINPVSRALKRELTMRTVKPRTVKATKEQIISLGKALPKILNGYFMEEKGFYYQPQPIQGYIIQILLFEGLRPSEVMSMKWTELDSNIYSTDTKTGQKQFRLTAPTMRIINSLERKSEFVFPSPINPKKPITNIRKTWITLCKLAGIEDLNLYDLRKTFSSAGTKKFGLHTSSKLTGHSNLSTVSKHYSHLDMDEITEAKEEIAGEFENLLLGGGKVVKFGK
jgi:integrase